MLPLATLSPTSTCKRVLWVTQSNAAPLKKASGEGPARASNDKIDWDFGTNEPLYRDPHWWPVRWRQAWPWTPTLSQPHWHKIEAWPWTLTLSQPHWHNIEAWPWTPTLSQPHWHNIEAWPWTPTLSQPHWHNIQAWPWTLTLSQPHWHNPRIVFARRPTQTHLLYKQSRTSLGNCWNININIKQYLEYYSLGFLSASYPGLPWGYLVGKYLLPPFPVFRPWTFWPCFLLSMAMTLV